MTCNCHERIAELEQEVRRLKRLVGESADEKIAHKVSEFMRRSGELRSPGAGRIVAALYAAEGRPVSQYSLLEAVPPTYARESQDRSVNAISVWVHVIRKNLGEHTIETVRQRGYRLSDEGREFVEKIMGESAGAGSHPVVPPLTLSR